MKLKQKVIPLLLTIASSSVMAVSASPNILWHNSSTGAIKFMPVNGMTPENTLSVVDSSNTNLLPKGIGDFTGDGKPDILFHNQNSGNLRIWEMDGTTKGENIQVLGSSNTNLQIAGVGDFDGDGDNDIATFNTNSGSLRMWVMEGTVRVDNILVLSGANVNLVPRGAGDMDGDGIPDIVLRNNNSGTVRVWTMNDDLSRKGNVSVTGSSNTNLELRGIMDINGDGNNDILNYNVATGKLRAWLMDGSLGIIENAEIVQDADPVWSVRGGTNLLDLVDKVPPIVTNVTNVQEFRKALRDAATNGGNDIIVLDKGLYSTAEDSQGVFYFGSTEEFNLTIKAKDGLTQDDVILDGNDTSRVLNVTISNTENVLSIENITLQNGAEILSHRTYKDGGALSTPNSLVLNKVKIKKCVGRNGGAIYLNGIGTKDKTYFIHIKDSNISENAATDNGSAIFAKPYAHYTEVDFTNVEFSSNYGESSLIEFEGYSATEPMNIIDCKFLDNSKNDSSDPLLSLINVQLYIKNTRFYGNTISNYGDMLYVTDLTMEGSQWKDNSTWAGNLIRIANEHREIAQIFNNSFVNNSVAWQTGTVFQSDSVMFVNNLFLGNSAVNPNTGLIVANGYIINNTFYDNSPYDGESILNASGILINNIFNNDPSTVDIKFGSDSKVYNNYIDFSKINTNGKIILYKNNLELSDGEIFLTAEGQLDSNSIAIDMGLNPSSPIFKDLINNEEAYALIKSALTVDILGNTRIHQGDPISGSLTIDMGASEYNLSK